MNSPFAYQAPCWKRADCAEPVHTTEFVERPKIAPFPPVAKITASAGKVLISIVFRFIAQMPRDGLAHRGRRGVAVLWWPRQTRCGDRACRRSAGNRASLPACD